MSNMFCYQRRSGFTIVELLVVIVIIGILAAITITSYSGITNKAKIVSLQSDLSNASNQLKMFYMQNDEYPATISTDCVNFPTNTTNICLKASPGNSYTTVPYLRPTPQSFILTEVNGANIYHITDNSAATKGVFFDNNWIVIGTQVWSKYNQNVGSMIDVASAQTNNSTLEKYCYANLESNCTTYGALYQWNEAMQYSTTEGSRGICPAGTHIPTDNDWKVLEKYLGMSQVEVDDTDSRGTNEGAKLKSGGSSGLNVPLAGSRSTVGVFSMKDTLAYLWSSSQSSTDAWDRAMSISEAVVYRDLNNKNYAFSVRCLGD